MEYVFNELSKVPIAADEASAFKRVKLFAETYRACSKLGAKVVRISDDYGTIVLFDGYTLMDLFNDNRPTYRTLKTFLLGVLRTPYLPDENNSKEADQFAAISVKCCVDRIAYGFAVAYVLDRPAIGFLSEEQWEELFHAVTVEEDGNKSTKVLPCVAKPGHVADSEFKTFLLKRTSIELLSTSLKAAEKKTDFSGNHHGKSNLRSLFSILKKSPYVIEPITSVEFRPHAKSYVDQCDPDGKIVVVDIKTDEGFALQIQTTGRNLYETEAIGVELRKMF